MTSKLEQLYEGKAKRVFATDTPDLYIVSYKDDATAYNGEKKGSISGKGVVNNIMSNHLFTMLEENGIRTHFVEQLSERETVVRALKIIPLEVIVRNLAAGSMAKRLGLVEGTELMRPIVEFCYKDDSLGDPLITDDHALILGAATVDELAFLKSTALRINELLSAYLRKQNILLVDFKLEFGKSRDGQVMLGDEISPDTCRFWDATTREKLDKDRFRRDLGGVEEAYQEALRRVLEG